MTEGPSFVYKVYSILEQSDYDDIVSWNDDGDGFEVKNIGIFQSEILPNYFKHSNYASFVRQLNMYDFHKTEKYSFKHSLFRRNHKELISQIKRKSNEQVIIVPQSIEKIYRELSLLILRNQDLENLFKYIIQQSDKLLKENQFLWHEISKISQQNKKQDKLDNQLIAWVLNNFSPESILKLLEKRISKKELIHLLTLLFQQEQKNKKIKVDFF